MADPRVPGALVGVVIFLLLPAKLIGFGGGYKNSRGLTSAVLSSELRTVPARVTSGKGY